jgi:hypothetical protein
MAINYCTSAAFADHYRTGKFTDLGLVAKDGIQFNVHKLVVCSHSPVLDAQAADGTTILDTGDDATTLGQMIEWMYGIDDEQLLIDGKSVEEVIALGSSEVYSEILTLSDLANIAEKVRHLHMSYACGSADSLQYQLPKLKYQATELVGQLVENTTSLQCLLEAVLHLARENAKGTMQKILTSRALDLDQAQGDDSVVSHGENTLTHREKHRPTPLSTHGDATEHNESESSVNIDRSALRSAKGPSKHARQEDTDSDTPLKKQSSKRQKQNDRPPVNTLAPKAAVKANQTAPATTTRLTPQSQASGQNTVSQQTQTQPGPNVHNPRLTNHAHNFSKDHQDWLTETQQGIQKLDNELDTKPKSRPTRRNEPFRISTALPENDPPKGPHCHCKASSTDPTLLACADCGNKYHPRCVGKGKYSKGTYYGNHQHYMLKDLELFKEKPFKCGDCEAGFFGGR